MYRLLDRIGRQVRMMVEDRRMKVNEDHCHATNTTALDVKSELIKEYFALLIVGCSQTTRAV